jgi:uncharacterized membrane protein
VSGWQGSAPPTTHADSNGQAISEAAPREQEPVGLERVIFFSDAVFAIVITLLVLPLTAEIELPEGGRDLAAHVWEQWPRVLSFLVSFMVIGQFWVAHHHCSSMCVATTRACCGSTWSAS